MIKRPAPGDWAQIAAVIGSLLVATYGAGVAYGMREKMEPRMQAQEIITDSMARTQTDFDRRLDEVDAKLDRVLCYLQSEAENFDAIRCAR